jgi:hypothetical protein
MNPAFAYIYDDFLSDRRYERELGQVETELARHGIGGRTFRLSPLTASRDLIKDLVMDGAKNVVFVGNDLTVEKMMWFLPDLDVTIGYIPITDKNPLAELLGISFGAPAVDILAARFVETFDIGKINDRYFFTEVVLPSTKAALEIEGRYRVSPRVGGAIVVRNLGGSLEHGNADPKDGWLEAVIQTVTPGVSSTFWKKAALEETRIPLQNGAIIAQEPTDIYVDGHITNGSKFRLQIIPNKLRMITGRRRRLEAGMPMSDKGLAMRRGV